MKYKKLNLLTTLLIAGATTIFAASNPLSSNLNNLVNTPVTSDPGYFPLQIVNNLKDTNNITDAYFLMVAKKYSNPANACIMHFTLSQLDGKSVAIGSCQIPAAGENIGNKAQKITTLPGYSSSTHSVVLYIPKVQSGRAFLSLNHKLNMRAVESDGLIGYQAPDDSNPNDPSYDVIYDKFEFSYDQTSTFWINPTSVDFFSLPISLIQYGTQPNEQHLIEPYSGAPLYENRSRIIQNMTSTLSASPWDKLEHKYHDSVIRVAAPHIAPNFPTTTYLDNFVTFLKTYYKTHYITIDASELVGTASDPMPLGVKYGYDESGQPKYPISEYRDLYQFRGHINDNGDFIFNNTAIANYHGLEPISLTINMNNIQNIAKGFFEPGKANTPFATPNKTLQSVIIKNLTAAWSIGMLPAYGQSYQESAKPGGGTNCNAYTPDHKVGVLLNSCYFTKNKADHKYYTLNPTFPTGSHAPTKAWYDLYAKAIHNVIPNTYAYAYDDVVKQDGTLTGQINTQPITVVLGDMSGITIPTPPPPTQFLPATVTQVTDSRGTSDSLHCDGNNCTTKIYFNAPTQAGVSYYAMPNNLYTISSNKLAKMQNIIPGTSAGHGKQDYHTTLTIPQKDVTGAPAAGNAGTVNDLQVHVFSCSNFAGGNCPGRIPDEGVPPATGSAIYPTPKVNVIPPTISSHTGYRCSGETCTATLKWTIPAGEGASVKYYVLLQGYKFGSTAGFKDNIFSLTAEGATSQTITVNKSDLVPNLTGAQVFACSTESKNCPDSTNKYAPKQSAPGSTMINLTKIP